MRRIYKRRLVIAGFITSVDNALCLSQFLICTAATFGGFLYGLNWTLSSVVGPQLTINGQKATLEQVSWLREFDS